LGVEVTRRLHDAAWTGAYAPEVTEAVYAELIDRARCVLSSGRPVVLDASFRSPSLRNEARKLARAHGVPFYFVECRAALDECRRRLERRAGEVSVSDGRLEIFDEFVARWAPPTEVPEHEHVIVDTTKPIDENAGFLGSRLPVWPPGLTE